MLMYAAAARMPRIACVRHASRTLSAPPTLNSENIGGPGPGLGMFCLPGADFIKAPRASVAVKYGYLKYSHQSQFTHDTAPVLETTSGHR